MVGTPATGADDALPAPVRGAVGGAMGGAVEGPSGLSVVQAITKNMESEMRLNMVVVGG